MDTDTLYWIGDTFFYILLFFILVLLGNTIFKLKYKGIDIHNELSEKDNVAFSLVVLGYIISILIIFLGIIHTESHEYIKEAKLIIGYGLTGILLLLLSSYINEKIVFRNKVILFKEIFKDENKGVGYVEAANYIGSSLLIFGAISGKTINFFSQETEFYIQLSGLISLITLWLLGQLFISFFLKIYIRVSKYDIINQLEKDNVAVGIVFSGLMIAISILFSNAVLGDIEDIELYIEHAIYSLILGIILLPISRLFLDKLVFPKTNLIHEIVLQKIPNQGIALIEAFIFISSAIVISFCI